MASCVEHQGVNSEPHVLNTYSRIPVTHHEDTNNASFLCNPEYDIHMCIFKVTVFIKQAKHE